MRSNSKLVRAIRLLESGEVSEARRILEAMVSDDPQNQDALGQLAWLYKSKGMMKKAIATYKKYIMANDTDGEAYYQLAEIYFMSSRFRMAAKLTAKAIQLNPYDGKYSLLLRDIHEKMGLCGRDEVRDTMSIDLVLESMESDPRFFPTSMDPSMARLIYSLVLVLRPKIIVEIGSYVGYSTCTLAKALEQSSKGHLHVFDIFEDEEVYKNTVKNVKSICSGENYTFHVGDSSRNVEKVFESNNMIIDFAFIDGDHTIDGVLKDFRAVDRFLKEDGMIILHDTNPPHCRWLGPALLLNLLADSDYSVMNLVAGEDAGIAILQKNAEGECKVPLPRLIDTLREYVFLKTKW